MLFILFRLIFFLLLLLVLLILIRKSKMAKKKLAIILSLILCALLGTTSYLFPLENIFISFYSPQEVYKYSSFGTVEDVIYGEDSCFILSTNSYSIIPKESTGYKIPSILSIKTVIDQMNAKGSFKIYNANNTNDFYIWGVTICKDKEVTVTDSNHSEIKILLTKNGDTNYYTVLIYGRINMSDDYALFINGEAVV